MKNGVLYKQPREEIVKWISMMLAVMVFVTQSISVKATEDVLSIVSPSAILIEASTGKVIYEKNAQEVRSPASITKIMTMLLIFEALEHGKIRLEDEVTTSAYAKSMGGSQVFLEEGEKQTVDTLIKCIAVASGNDASVCMAEYIEGSEEAFVEKMNKKAAELGMQQTHFVDCCGLTNSEEHHTSAKDVAIMSRELITKYPQVFDYTQIWMENITHVTGRGSKEFTLSSTNKLLKQYEWTTGLKTGSTQKAKYCLSATAQKDGISLIAVIMGAPDFKIRFSEAKTLLEYGYRVAGVFRKDKNELTGKTAVAGSLKEYANYGAAEDFVYLDTTGMDFSQVEAVYELPEKIEAPVNMGDEIGKVVFWVKQKELGSVPLVALEDVQRATFIDWFKVLYGELLY